MRAAMSHQKANAQESPIKIFAGLILNRRNASVLPNIIPISVVAKYRWLIKVIMAIKPKTIIISPPTKPSSQSVILIALTIVTVRKKVMMAYQNPRCISPAKGQRLI